MCDIEQDPACNTKEDDEQHTSNETEVNNPQKIDAVQAPSSDWSTYPYKDIKEPHQNDVLYGRGGGTNHHPGNKRYRQMVEDRKIDYVNSKRLDKPMVALGIIQEWRQQEPPGRFLKMDDKTGLWNDVGDKKAREKTSQALREKAPQIRIELDKERLAKERIERGEESDESEDDLDGSNRTAAGADGNCKPGVVARGHSLGVEYLGPAESMSLKGFSWQDPVRQSMDRTGSQGSYVPQAPPQFGFPDMRMGSLGSCHGSFGPPPMPHPPGSYPQDPMVSWGRYESWGSMGPNPPPPMIYNGYPPTVHQSGNWEQRDHSLAQNPLTYATATQPAYPGAFEHTRTASGIAWGPPHSYPVMASPPPYALSGGAPPGEHYLPPQPHQQLNAPPSPKYNVDVNVASQWSGRDPSEIAKTLSGGSDEGRDGFEVVRKAATPRFPVKSQNTPKPDIVKRMTSNQNETNETKHDLGYDGRSVRRAVLGREGSVASNRLKEKYLPEYFDTKKEVDMLSTNFQQSTLESCTNKSAPRPSHFRKDDRMTTLDMSALDLVVKPIALGTCSRSTTIEALSLDLDDSFGEESRQVDWLNVSMNASVSKVPSVPKPPTLSLQARLTTSDLIDIVNEPLLDD